MFNTNGKNTIMGLIYMSNTEPRVNTDIFSLTLFDILDDINTENKVCVIMGNMNIDLLQFGSPTKTSDYLDNIFTHGFLPVITKPTPITISSATLIDHNYTTNLSTGAN